MKMIQLFCDQCSKPFDRRFSYHRHLVQKRGITAVFCNKKCKDLAHTSRLPADLAAQYLAGATLQTLGDKFGVSGDAIRLHLIAQGINRRPHANSGEKNGMYGRCHTAESIEKIRQATYRQFIDPSARERHALLTCQQLIDGKTKNAYNKFETRVAGILEKQGLAFVQQFRIGRFLYDFRICDTNRLIEAHGTYWHADPRFYAPERQNGMQRRNVANDMRKADYATSHGYVLEYIWESDVI